METDFRHQRFHLEINSLEDFAIFVALIRKDDALDLGPLTARLRADADKINSASETLGEASAQLGGLSPETTK